MSAASCRHSARACSWCRATARAAQAKASTISSRMSPRGTGGRGAPGCWAGWASSVAEVGEGGPSPVAESGVAAHPFERGGPQRASAPKRRHVNAFVCWPHASEAFRLAQRGRLGRGEPARTAPVLARAPRSSVMPQYRFFFVRDDGMPSRGTAFPFASDQKAIEFAELAARGQRAELWSGSRLVWRAADNPN